MNQIAATGPNADQIEFWNGDPAERWVSLGDQLDAMLRPLGAAGIEQLAPEPGHDILDVGCGCGETTIDLAQRVAPGGSVTGVDISEVMLSHARTRPKPDDAAPITFQNADAETHEFPAASFDRIFSRFGVMFFQNPGDAFANFRRSLRPGGRVTFVCWRTPRENPWVAVPVGVAKRHLEWPEAPPPGSPGQFAFAERAHIESVLDFAGLKIETVEALDLDVIIAGGGGVRSAIDFFFQQGPAARVLGEATEAQRDAVRADLEGELAPFLTPDGVRLGTGTWIVSTRAAE